MTGTKREGQWLNSVQNPFTKQYEKLEPSLEALNIMKKKKVDKIRRKILSKKRKALNPPFNVCENRSFEYLGKTLGPGPGTYINVNDPKFSSVLHKHTTYGNPNIELMKANSGSNNFGSSIDRFNNPDYKKNIETPGPGAYTKPITRNDNSNDVILNQTVQEEKREQFNFKSKTNRFTVEGRESNSLNRSRNKDKNLPLKSITINTQQSNPRFFMPLATDTSYFKDYKSSEELEKVPFGSNTLRFMFKQLFYGHELQDTPGPGYYAD